MQRFDAMHAEIRPSVLVGLVSPFPTTSEADGRLFRELAEKAARSQPRGGT